MKLIPAGGVDNHLRINSAVLAILESTFGVCRFYLVRDRDYLTPEMAHAYAARSRGRLHVLARNQIENYLLIPELIRKVLLEQYDKAQTAGEIKERLRNIARTISGEVLRDMTAFRLNMLFRPQDFSLGSFFEKTAVFDPSHARIPEKLAAFDKKVLETVEQVRKSTDALAGGAAGLLEAYKSEVECAVKDDCWQTVFPGKALLAGLAQGLELKSDVGFVNALIKEMAASEEFIGTELLLLRDTILLGAEFTAPPITVTAPTAASCRSY